MFVFLLVVAGILLFVQFVVPFFIASGTVAAEEHKKTTVMMAHLEAILRDMEQAARDTRYGYDPRDPRVRAMMDEASTVIFRLSPLPPKLREFLETLNRPANGTEEEVICDWLDRHLSLSPNYGTMLNSRDNEIYIMREKGAPIPKNDPARPLNELERHMRGEMAKRTKHFTEQREETRRKSAFAEMQDAVLSGNPDRKLSPEAERELQGFLDEEEKREPYKKGGGQQDATAG